ncbi:uncharacterized protein [Centruroides vittatus]|uniref:uncharacterized protein isoform X2 n=1 Tax=Centruroides vittatus TaxID=120091 RepID=UPI003510BDD6
MRNEEVVENENGFSDYVHKCLKRHLESTVVEVELSSENTNKNFTVNNDGIFLFASSSEKLNDVQNDDEDNSVKIKKFHKHKKKKKNHKSDCDDNDDEKIHAIAVSGDWILQNSAIHANNNVFNEHLETPNDCTNKIKKKKKKKKSSEKDSN